eukprot:scaffold1936_cov154-Amphora_coffeaeformis.AAC.10
MAWPAVWHGASQSAFEMERVILALLFSRKALIQKLAVRVVMTQGSTVYSNYLSDQLREDMRRDELVNEGRMSRSEAEQQAEEWENQEWPKRWEGFSKKLLVAYAKYHAITVVMRIYEAIAAKMYDDVMVDKLTIDTYSSTLRREKAGQKTTSREVFSECWYSNLVCYLADYSVHQVIVTFGYYMYVREQRRKLKSQNEKEAREAANELHPGSLVLSFTKKSVALGFTRAVGLLFASLGGVIGTSFWPGWGTVIGINMGDGFAITITDEIVTI